MKIQRIKTEKTKDYTIINNTIFKDSSITLKAKGLFSMVMSLPDNWDFSVAGMISIIPEGKTAVYSALAELLSKGYVKRVYLYENGKRIKGGVEYTFMETPVIPIENLNLENLNLENLNLENKPQYNTYYNKEINEINKEKEKKVFPSFSGIETTEIQKAMNEKRAKENPEFEEFCNAYPNKLGKAKSLNAFNKAIKSIGKESLYNCLKVYKEYVANENKAKEWLKFMYISTFLNGEYLNYLEIAKEQSNAPTYKGINFETVVRVTMFGRHEDSRPFKHFLMLCVKNPRCLDDYSYNGNNKITAAELPEITTLLNSTTK